jgi:hypothetical protein
MKYVFSMVFLTMVHLSYGQDGGDRTITPIPEIPYLRLKDTLSTARWRIMNGQNELLSGKPEPVGKDFLAYQLLLDRMSCLVPGKNNPAMVQSMVKPMPKPEVALIPNAIKPER